MQGFGSKVWHTFRNEGAGSVLRRSGRYAAYRARRMAMSKADTLEDWRRLKGAYSGRAFLIGNGPSLNRTELYLLSDEHTMCFNRFDLMMERLDWTPSFYTTIDDRVLLDTIDEVNEISRVSDHAFFPDIHPFNVDFRSRIEKRRNVHWLFLDRASFSLDLPYCGILKTVANVGLQILAYLGFTEIILLGVDMTYSIPASAKVEGARDVTAGDDDDESHFDPRYFGKGRKFHVPMLDETFVKFREARVFFEQHGVKVLNATVGGVLEEFERTTLDQVLGLDQAEKRRRFTQAVRAHYGPTADPLAAMKTSPRPGSPEDVEPGWASFVVPAERVAPFVMKTVFDYVPFGPLEDDVLFWRRSSNRDGV